MQIIRQFYIIIIRYYFYFFENLFRMFWDFIRYIIVCCFNFNYIIYKYRGIQKLFVEFIFGNNDFINDFNDMYVFFLIVQSKNYVEW